MKLLIVYALLFSIAISLTFGYWMREVVSVQEQTLAEYINKVK